MRYVCSKKYKILCKENCYHVKNIKEEKHYILFYDDKSFEFDNKELYLLLKDKLK